MPPFLSPFGELFFRVKMLHFRSMMAEIFLVAPELDDLCKFGRFDSNFRRRRKLFGYVKLESSQSPKEGPSEF